MAMVRFSIQPSSSRRATKAFVQGLKAVGSAPRKPMVGSFPACCARAPSGQNVAAPAMALTKSRRRIAAPPQVHANNTLITAGIKGWWNGIRQTLRSIRAAGFPPLHQRLAVELAALGLRQ